MKNGNPLLFYKAHELEPILSAETIRYHYGKHLQAYIATLDKLKKGTEYEEATLEEMMQNAPEGNLLNIAGQVLNHAIYFSQFSDDTLRKAPYGEILEMAIRDFGGMDEMKRLLEEAALGIFGSGWAFLALTPDGHLAITQEANAGNPLRHGMKPLLCIDMWEHAYYIDYRNRRDEYVHKLWEVTDWRTINVRLERAKKNNK